jgi:ubiquinone/menaquinone biosynthesis C-methylase UbiE
MSTDDTTRIRARMPRGTENILDTRTLSTSHRRLAQLLEPGMMVLDVGCGTGAITRGVAEIVGEQGEVIGLDSSEMLISDARAANTVVPGLSFVAGDVYSLPYRDTFDIVSAARVLQWLAKPADALRQITAATRPGGRVLVLDYNHEKIRWNPEPPESFLSFYDAFLRWRSDAGMDNRLADHLEALFQNVGLDEIQVSEQHETTVRSDDDFVARASLWTHVAASRGHQIVRDGYLREDQRAEAERAYCHWVEQDGRSQTMYLLAVDGIRTERDDTQSD